MTPPPRNQPRSKKPLLLANMVIVLTMGGLAVRALDDYFHRLKAGEIVRHDARKVIDMVEDKS